MTKHGVCGSLIFLARTFLGKVRFLFLSFPCSYTAYDENLCIVILSQISVKGIGTMAPVIGDA